MPRATGRIPSDSAGLGGKLAGIVPTPLVVPVNDMQKLEDVHFILLHVIMQILCAQLRAGSGVETDQSKAGYETPWSGGGEHK
jgi:hypothetical protein